MYFASAFAIQICIAEGCAVLRGIWERGLGAPRCAGATGTLPASGGRTLPMPWLSRTRRQSWAGLPASLRGYWALGRSRWFIWYDLISPII